MRQGAGPFEAGRSSVDWPQEPRHAQPQHGYPEPKRVVIVGPSAAALATDSAAMIHEIRRRGNQVFCYTPRIDRASAHALARLGAETAELPRFNPLFSPLADQRSIARLVNAFRRIQPDIVAGVSPKAAVLAGLAARLAKVERRIAIIGELGQAFDDQASAMTSVSRKLQKSLLRMALRLNDTAIFLNEENHKLLQQQKFLPQQLRQFPVNGCGIDLRQFPPLQLPPLDRGVMFLFAGPLDLRLGIEDYCEAARLLRAKSGNFRCMIAGPEVHGPDGFPLSELKSYRDVVQYLGPHTDPRPYIARTHVVVLPAEGDTIPHILMEAIAMGRPVITTSCRGCRVTVREGSNGIIVPVGDATALASAMARLLLRPDLIPSMARASRELAVSQFDERRVNAQLMGAFGL